MVDKIVHIFIYTTTLLVLLIVLKPLHKLSKSVEGLFLVFVDSIFQAINVSITLTLKLLCLTNDDCNGVPWAITFVNQILVNLNAICQSCLYGLLLIIALNRFHAIFLPFTYNKFWRPRNKKLLLLINVLQATLFRILFILDGQKPFLYYHFYLQYYILCTCLPLVVYLMLLIKFSCSCNVQMGVTPNELRQDRIRIAFICFLTILPVLLSQFSIAWLDLIAQFFFGTRRGTFQLDSEKDFFPLLLAMLSRLAHIIGILVLRTDNFAGC